MLDISYFRVEAGKIKLVKESQRRRGLSTEDVEEVSRLDDEWRNGIRIFLQ
jgi:hypothetical protein